MFLEKNKEILDLELLAILETLTIASTKIKAGNISITVFYDFQKLLNTLALQHTGPRNQYMQNLIGQ